jgi:hypothetical protein
MFEVGFSEIALIAVVALTLVALSAGLIEVMVGGALSGGGPVVVKLQLTGASGLPDRSVIAHLSCTV